MSITVMDVVRSVVGEKSSYNTYDFDEAGVPMFGGCQGCGARIAAFGAHPSQTGFLRCADCIGDLGFETLEVYTAWTNRKSCQYCGTNDGLQEVTVDFDPGDPEVGPQPDVHTFDICQRCKKDEGF